MAGIFDTFGVNPDEVTVPTGGGPGEGVYPNVAIKRSEIVKGEFEKGDRAGEKFIKWIIGYEIPGYEFLKEEHIFLPTRPAGPDGHWDTTVIGQRNGYDVSEDSQNQYNMGILKKRLLSLGIPESRLKTVVPGDLIGIDNIVLTLKKKGDWVNISEVAIAKPTDTNLPQADNSDLESASGLWD